MGMPVSLALRGRHAATAEGRAAWAAVMAELVEVDRVFSTYRTDSVVSRLDRGELDLDGLPAPWSPRSSRSASRPRRESDGAFSTSLPVPGDATGRRRLDPSGVVKGWAAERAARHLARLDDTDFCLSAGGDITCRADPHSAPWRIGVEDPHDPSRVDRRRPAAHRCGRHVRHRAPRRPPRRRPDRAPAHRRRLGHRRRTVADLGRHRRHGRVRAGQPGGGVAPDPTHRQRPRRRGGRHGRPGRRSRATRSRSVGLARGSRAGLTRWPGTGRAARVGSTPALR